MIQDDSTLKWYLYGDVSERETETEKERQRETERDRAREKVNITRDHIS